MATREILSLDTATPQIVAPQTGDTYSAPRAVAIAPESLTGASATTSLDIAQTWNTTGTPTAVKCNVTDTASNAASLFMDLGTGGGSFVSKFKVDKTGTVTVASSGGITAATNLIFRTSSNSSINFFGSDTSNDFVTVTTQANGALSLRSAGQLGFTAFTYSNASLDTILTRKAAASLRFGAADAAAPVAQTLNVQGVVAGTSNTAGVNLTVNGSQGTGTGVGGDIIFQVTPAGSAGTAQNTLAQAMRIYNTKTVAVGSAFTVSTLPAAGTQGRRAWVTDALAPTFLGTLTGGGSVISPVFDNGTAWVAG